MTLRRFLMVLSAFAVFCAFPGAIRAAQHYREDGLVGLIPMLPAFVVVFFWIINTLVNFFIQADSYKDPKAIKQAQSFLWFFDRLFLLIFLGFIAGSIVLYRAFPPAN